MALGLWLIALKAVTGHWLGNAEFTEYNVFYPLNPVRLCFALFVLDVSKIAGRGATATYV